MGNIAKEMEEKLRKQIEFYFSDANLNQDRFMYNCLTKDCKGVQSVCTDIILSFPRVKEILQELNKGKTKSAVELLKSALESSKLLRLSPDFKQIERKKRFHLKKCKLAKSEKRKIYVENLPEDVTHEKLASMFGKVGTVLHVSIPKNGTTKQPKGFAFIEYKHIKSVDNAIKTFDGVMKMKDWLERKKEYKRAVKSVYSSTVPAERKEKCAVHIDNLPLNATKASIRLLITNFEEPVKILHNKGETCAIATFSEEATAESFIKRYNCRSDVLRLNGNRLILRKLSKEV